MMSFWEKRSESLTIRRILKVNHAGEFGAIRIYNAQIWVGRRLFPHIVPALQDMRDDEIEHCRLFFDAMPARRAKPCRVMGFWSLGGSVLGFLTACMGENMVWVCTEAVEDTVHRHLNDQLAFLAVRDKELGGLIASIQEEEQAHLEHAIEQQRRKGWLGVVAKPVIALLTESMIWLSTWGDSSRMKSELDEAS